jgi:trimeric autotransporter adhesin
VLIDDTGHNMIRVVAAHTGTYYGEAMTAGYIYDVAGLGGACHSFASGQKATAVHLCGAASIAVDADGNILLANTDYDTVYAVAARTGTFYGQAMIAGHIYLLAGQTLKQGNTGNGGLATSAELNVPQAVGTDGAGNVLVGDGPLVAVVAASSGTFYGQRMTAGHIYTIAGLTGLTPFWGNGHPAVDAELGQPHDVAVDGAGNWLIADPGDNRVHVIATAAGTFYGQSMKAGYLYTIAGDGTAGYSGDGGRATGAELQGPDGVAVDGAGNVLIADAGNQRIRVVATVAGTFYGQPMTAGDIYTIAGNGTAGYSGDGGPATGAELQGPASVAVDAAGNVLIADTYNERIRVVAASDGTFYGQSMTAGDIYTVAGGGDSTANGVPASTEMLFDPNDVTVDHDGNIVIADTDNNVVQVVAARTGTFYGQPMTGGDIYTVAGGGSQVYSAGQPATSVSLYRVESAYVDPAGTLLLVSSGQVLAVPSQAGTYYGVKMAMPGDIYTVAGDGDQGYAGDGGPAVDALLDQPYGIDTDAAGNLLICDSYNLVIRQVTG